MSRKKTSIGYFTDSGSFVRTTKSKSKYRRWGGGKDSYKWTGGSSNKGGSYTPPAPAPKAAAPAPAAAAAPAPAPISNPYREQADALMKTIKDMETNQAKKIEEIQEAAKKRINYATPQAVNPSNLTIASAGTQPNQSGTGSFKRRMAPKKTTSNANLRTINSMNI
jgi:hypothetical protein